MTEHGVLRRGRRRDGFVALTFGVLVIFAGLSFRIGPAWAVLCALALPAITFGATELVLRRVAGDGWAASLPLVFAHRLGLPGAGRHGRWSDKQRYDRQELLGRLVIDGDILRWEPREADCRRGVPPIEWQRPWGGELVRLWGPDWLRCLTLPGPDGELMDLWIRDPRGTAGRLIQD
ncbi:hypothetical protein [Kutzneria sp. CA-103260]|uniref:hypothetical protein n=1 Tax=Kutzneria sp. CA-103260 TaxID=2802641 RepID=UPI001BA7DDC2|nr:hypothetical protein [Kutzneria sp. CA-103260]QUQ66311.1 hypothetical protein JJ691_40380 [Kutzneria sp. CA-103260]